MEQFNDKIEKIKCLVTEILAEMGLITLYSDTYIEDYVLSPFTNTADTYRTALAITDELIAAA